MTKTPERLLKLSEVAAECRVSVSRVKAWAAMGKLRTLAIDDHGRRAVVRVTPKELRRFKKEHETPLPRPPVRRLRKVRELIG